MFTRSVPFYLLKQTRLVSTNASLGEILRGNLFVRATDTDSVDLRTRLLEELKLSLKAKDSLASTTIRSVLSEVYSADKVSNDKNIDSSAIALLVRKAYARRVCPFTLLEEFIYSFRSLEQLDSAVQFNQASRPDLAGKEQQEANLLARFLPPLLPEAEVDRILQDVMAEQLSQAQDDPRKSVGRIFKAFYAKVDRASVDPDLLKRRAEVLLSS